MLLLFVVMMVVVLVFVAQHLNVMAFETMKPELTKSERKKLVKVCSAPTAPTAARCCHCFAVH